MKTTRTALALTAALGGALVAGIPASASASESRGTTVYTETNAVSGNAVLNGIPVELAPVREPTPV